MLSDLILIVAALAGSFAGLIICWRAWRTHALGAAALLFAGIPWALATSLWIFRFGAEIGVPLALETAALAAFAFILTRIEHRPEKIVRAREAPPLPPRNYWLGAARVLVAGGLGFAGAMGPALLFATQAPLEEQTRLIIAALFVPSLWCAAIGWTVCHRRLGLQTLTFTVLAAGGAGLTYAMV